MQLVVAARKVSVKKSNALIVSYSSIKLFKSLVNLVKF